MTDGFYEFLKDIIEWQEERAHHPWCHGNPHNACGCSCNCGYKPVGQQIWMEKMSLDSKPSSIFNPDGSFKDYNVLNINWNEIK